MLIFLTFHREMTDHRLCLVAIIDQLRYYARKASRDSIMSTPYFFTDHDY